MGHRLFRAHAALFNGRQLFSEELVALILALFVFAVPASASTRLTDRSLFITSPVPGAVTSYKLSFQYVSPQAIGSVDMLFCVDPIPYMPCVTPPGLDVSNAVLSSQTGETGFSILSQSTNHIILSRPAQSLTAGGLSSYIFDNIKNPTDTTQAYSIRLRTHTSTDATGTQVDFGSVRAQVTDGIVIQTQVPPMLLFCVAQQVDEDCAHTNDVYYSDMGNLSADDTLVTQSQMAVGTNATDGFVITANGTPPAAGTNVIDGAPAPSESTQGTNQFGINLVENTAPSIGHDPEGTWANAVAADDYNQPNKYKFVSGDPIAYSPNVSLFKKFTVSYIINSSPNLRAGVYTTTITYIASGRF